MTNNTRNKLNNFLYKTTVVMVALNIATLSMVASAAIQGVVSPEITNGLSLERPTQFEENKSDWVKNEEQKACDAAFKQFEVALNAAHKRKEFLTVTINKEDPYGIIKTNMVTVPGEGGFSMARNDPLSAQMVPDDAPIWTMKKCSVSLNYDVNTDKELVELHTRFYNYIKDTTNFYFSMMPNAKKITQ